jgi:copper resistance protein D
VRYVPESRNHMFLAHWVVGLLLGLVLSMFASPIWPQQRDMSDMDGMPGMNHGDMTSVGHEYPVRTAPPSADTQGSEFNHHLAGLILFLAGLILLAEERLTHLWPPSRYVWPMCFLAAGLFVLIFSDAEIWPLGPETPWYALSHSVEDLQHKSFAIILLGLGYVELERARGRFKEVWSALFFPIVGIAGAILLLFHVHGGDMSAPNAMAAMEHIESQHRWFAAAGLGIAVTKGLAEIPQRWQIAFKRMWPALLTVLGILLMAYTE